MLKLLVVVIGIAILYMYGPYFKKLDPVEFRSRLPITLDGPMERNEKLDAAERLFENKIIAPESFAVFEGSIYTGAADGRVIRFTNTSITEVCRIGRPCAGRHEQSICGRGLGMEVSKDGVLYAADPHNGLFAIDIKTGRKEQLLPSSKVVEGKPLTFLNSLAFDEEEQMVYLTQSSTKWVNDMATVSVLEHEASGRLLKYNIKENTVSVLLDGLGFPNGLALSHDRQSLLVAEMLKLAISRYYIKGPDKAQFKSMPMLLPGEPDNISHSKQGHYWVTVLNVRTSPTFIDKLGHYPAVRKGILITYHLLTAPIASVLSLMPSKKAKEYAFQLSSLEVLSSLGSIPAAIVKFDETGKIIESLHSPEGKISFISEVLEHNGYLYLGSWHNHFIARIRM